MYIKSYEYITSDKLVEDHMEISDISRSDYITRKSMGLLQIPKVTKPTGLLFAGGFSIHQGEGRRTEDTAVYARGSIEPQKSSLISRESTAFSIYSWAKEIEGNENIVYANINSDACASSMHCIYEAEQLINNGTCDEVIVIAEERTNFNTLRIFKEHRVPLICGDGIAVVVFSKDGNDSMPQASDSKWRFKVGSNPFDTSVEGYKLVDTDKKIDYIKPHGTGTKTNDLAEIELVKDRHALYYKKDIGHTQGVSAILELCMVLDDKNVNKGSTILCVASGFGGFYGSCIVRKPNDL